MKREGEREVTTWGRQTREDHKRTEKHSYPDNGTWPLVIFHLIMISRLTSNARKQFSSRACRVVQFTFPLWGFQRRAATFDSKPLRIGEKGRFEIIYFAVSLHQEQWEQRERKEKNVEEEEEKEKDAPRESNSNFHYRYSIVRTCHTRLAVGVRFSSTYSITIDGLVISVIRGPMRLQRTTW